MCRCLANLISTAIPPTAYFSDDSEDYPYDGSMLSNQPQYRRSREIETIAWATWSAAALSSLPFAHSSTNLTYKDAERAQDEMSFEPATSISDECFDPDIQAGDTDREHPMNVSIVASYYCSE